MISAARADDINRDECVQGSGRIATVDQYSHRNVTRHFAPGICENVYVILTVTMPVL